MQQIYEENLALYNKKYLPVEIRFTKLRDSFKTYKSKIHKKHHASFNFNKIESLIRLKSYEENIKAVAFIEKHELFKEQFESWERDLNDARKILQELKSSEDDIWAELYVTLEKQINNFESNLYGITLPKEGIFNEIELQVKQGIIDRDATISELRRQIDKYSTGGTMSVSCFEKWNDFLSKNQSEGERYKTFCKKTIKND